MKRRRKDAAELLEKLQADKQELQIQIGEAMKLLELDRKAEDQRRQKILAEACLAYLTDPSAKHIPEVEKLLMDRMTPRSLAWYKEHRPKRAVQSPPSAAAPVAAEARKSQGGGEDRGGNTASEQSTPDHA